MLLGFISRSVKSSRKSFHNNKIIVNNLTNELNLLTNQKLYVNKLNDDIVSLIIVSGPAGTGKTMLACYKAIDYLKHTDKKIIITRPAITVEENLGYLPGNSDEKMKPWTTPLFDYFSEHINKEKLNLYINTKRLEICPLGFMRGRTFNNAFIIADEMQNSSPNQMKMLVTRIGEESRLVITGDPDQSDFKILNGLEDIVNKVNNSENDEEIAYIKLTGNEISRSSVVKKMINLYENNK